MSVVKEALLKEASMFSSLTYEVSVDFVCVLPFSWQSLSLLSVEGDFLDICQQAGGHFLYFSH